MPSPDQPTRWVRVRADDLEHALDIVVHPEPAWKTGPCPACDRLRYATDVAAAASTPDEMPRQPWEAEGDAPMDEGSIRDRLAE